MASRLRYGIVGTGMMGLEHALNIRLIEDVEVTAIATGDEGKIECFVPDCDVILGRRKSRQVESVRVPVEERLLKAGFHHGSTCYEHVAFGAAVRSGTPPEVSFEDGLLAVAVGQAAELSAREGRPVELSELGVS